MADLLGLLRDRQNLRGASERKVAPFAKTKAIPAGADPRLPAG